MNPRFFRRQSAFRAWLERYHATEREVIVGFFHVGTGKPSITYPQARDEALCFGWIDGVRRNYDATSYTVRFTPRKPDSAWSAVNLARVRELKAHGRMRPAGLKAHEARDPKKAELYSFENPRRPLDAAAVHAFKANRRAWAWFETQAPWYRRTAAWWVMSAKREETRERRLAVLIAAAARGERAAPFNIGKAK
ncbi:MAG TPA: YdeI/OmpD-associated family protein [Gemmatimonadales bacterium]|nr:YdeI/OmpD-associated family protein [Gemmatimonadales bacterium]